MHLSPPPPREAPLSPPEAESAVRSTAAVLLLLIHCLVLLLLFMEILCMVLALLFILVLQLYWWGRESWLLYFYCLLDVFLWLFLTVQWVSLQWVSVVFPDHFFCCPDHFFVVSKQKQKTKEVYLGLGYENQNYNTNYCLMQVKSIAECSKGSILQYFRPSLRYHLSLGPLFFSILSDRLRQGLM